MRNDHLSDWEIEELIITSRDASAGLTRGDIRGHAIRPQADRDRQGSIGAGRSWQHLADCDLCSAHKDRLQELLLFYREDAVQRTDAILDRRDTHAAAQGKVSKAPFGFWRWGVWKFSLALVLLLAVMLPLLQRHEQKREQHEAQIAQDNLLLEQVDEEVDSSVPHPLQSLTNLVVARENTDE